ncbi:MAG: maleylpyruvate isomerase family mycothiol-dependent enzyme, partial [Mycobacterium leprae]
MAGIDDVDRAATAVLPLVAGLTPDDLARPTPCEAWNVRALVNHLTFGNRLFAGILRGEQPPPLDELLRLRDIDRLGDDPPAAFGASVDEFRTAFRQPEVAGQTFPTPAGPMPAD